MNYIYNSEIDLFNFLGVCIRPVRNFMRSATIQKVKKSNMNVIPRSNKAIPRRTGVYSNKKVEQTKNKFEVKNAAKPLGSLTNSKDNNMKMGVVQDKSLKTVDKIVKTEVRILNDDEVREGVLCQACYNKIVPRERFTEICNCKCKFHMMCCKKYLELEGTCPYHK